MSVHIESSITQKGYVLYDLEKRKLFISRDVMFKENVFPFEVSKSGDKSVLFPANTYGLFDTNYGRQIMIDHVIQPTELPEGDTRPSTEQVTKYVSNEITEDPPETSITQTSV